MTALASSTTENNYVTAVANLCRQAEYRLSQMLEEGTLSDKGSLVELEARVGTICSSGRFESGITPQLHQQFYDKMPHENTDQCPWFRAHPIEETHDYFYRDKNGRDVRDTVHFLPEKGLRIEHIHKQTISKIDIEIPDAPCDIRVSLATEIAVQEDSLPEKVEPHHVRIKRRRLFEYISRDMRHPAWNFAFTLSWSGKSRESAEMAQRQRPYDPVCEFEVECLHPMRYRQVHNQQYDYVAESLLRKVLGFLPPGGYATEERFLPRLILRQIMDIDTTGAVVPVWKSSNNKRISQTSRERPGNSAGKEAVHRSTPPPKRICTENYKDAENENTEK